MYVEKRRNGTFYLKESVYDPKTKRPKNKSVYLGANAIQAKEKLRLLTEDPALLGQIPDIQRYEMELDKVVKEIKKLNGFQAEGINDFISDMVHELLQAKQFIAAAQAGLVVLTADCPGCCFNKANHCQHFRQNFRIGVKQSGGKNILRCMAKESGDSETITGTIRLPCEFRER
ncbi:hypothetical protein P22_0256 [Propionispora sp. 2/2-37]|uniref:hypothetical protein n=1 Tax=Propionispora sp. 2/2-37 TaxID=1677858 RepID=UPI0006BB926E|nr:hypothetical protein [Propionispora sp. 2/2-37]CUH94190.1 hypothetical protein P22_0256 [Propionispora sp. 2/2-37]